MVAAPSGSTVHLADSLGVVDSARVTAGGVAFALPAWTGPVGVRAGDAGATAARAHAREPRRVVVLGRAGWEARFVATALEERGWDTEVRLGVAPGIAVTQGRPLPLDTARHAAVLVLDTLEARDAVAVVRFVAAGGGAVLGPGTAAGALAALAPAREDPRVVPAHRAIADDARPRLARRPLRPGPDAVALEREAGTVVAAARRGGPGRVVQVSYEETWRWRLGGGDGAADAHRDWWADVVAAAARVPMAEGPPAAAHDPAPVAALTAALGPARGSAARGTGGPDPRRYVGALALLAFGCLIAEWTSRRLRGAP